MTTKKEDRSNIKKRWQRSIFYGMYAGLSTMYLARRALGLMVPEIMKDIGMSKSQWGSLGTAFAITYGISKFTAGLLTDTVSSRYLLSLAVACTGVANIIFSMSESINDYNSYMMITIVWALNGYVQGMGFAPCAKLLKVWWDQNQRGTWWGLVSTAQNFGNSLLPILMSIPVVSEILLVQLGWRSTLFASGIWCFVMSLTAVSLIRDDPSECISTPTSSIEKKKNEQQTTSSSSTTTTTNNNEAAKVSTKDVIKLVVTNRNVWILGLSYFFIYVIKCGIADWAMLILTEHLAHSKHSAATCMLLFEIGGFVGGLSAGWLSDVVFKGNRVPVNVLFMIGNTSCLAALTYFSNGREDYVLLQAEGMEVTESFHLKGDWFLMFFSGLFIFGPMTLVGILSTELIDKRASGTALGFVGVFAAAGATVAGYPFGLVAQTYGWSTFLVCIVLCALLSTCLLLTMYWSYGSNEREKKERKKKKK